MQTHFRVLSHLVAIFMFVTSATAQTGSQESSLSDYNAECNHWTLIKSQACIDAASQACFNADHNPIGIPQELTPDGSGAAIACVDTAPITKSGSLIASKHSGCKILFKRTEIHRIGQSPACVAAAHRYCDDQPTTSKKLGKYVFGLIRNAGDKDDPTFPNTNCGPGVYHANVELTKLASLHNDCNDVTKSQTSSCMAAASRFCIETGKSGGVVQEVGESQLGIACFVSFEMFEINFK